MNICSVNVEKANIAAAFLLLYTGYRLGVVINMRTELVGDFPIRDAQQDLFNMSYYAETLATFITQASTPLTISIQGEWGSGKTSLMNLIVNELEKSLNTKYEIVRIEAWEYFIGNTSNSLERFALSLIDEIISRNNDSKLVQELQKVRKYSGVFVSKGISFLGGINQCGTDTIEDVKALVGTNELLSIIKNLRRSLEDLVKKNNQIHDENNVYIFLIDDLDRIEPESSVKVLEILKNIFYIPQCVFILSVDFEIVIKGLKKRYRDYLDGTPFNYRDYFDKLIQLTFTLPVSSYDVEPLFTNVLTEYGYWSNRELSFKDRSMIRDLLRLSVGNNPRKIKRLANAVYVSYLLDQRTSEFLNSLSKKLVNLVLLSMQQCYTEVYQILLMFPDYPNWTEESLASYLFDFEYNTFVEELPTESVPTWVKCLFKICLNNPELKKSIPAIKKLFEYLDTLISGNHKYIISQIIFLSTTTNPYPQIRYNGVDYQNNSFTQFRQGQKLVNMITPKANAIILDVGCGNGLTTIELFNRFHQTARIRAFDISPSQIEMAKKNRDSHLISEHAIEFYVMDMSDLTEDAYYDLIFSNSVLHWVSDPYSTYKKLYQALKVGGQIAIHQGGTGTYRGLHEMVKVAYTNLGLSDFYCNWDFPVFYPSVDELKDMLTHIGFCDVIVESVESNGTELLTLAEDFAKASLIFYYERIPEVYHKKLEDEFLKQCKINNVDYYTNRLYVFAKK